MAESTSYRAVKCSVLTHDNWVPSRRGHGSMQAQAHTHLHVSKCTDMHRFPHICAPAQVCTGTHVMDLNSNSHGETSGPLSQRGISIPVIDDCP